MATATASKLASNGKGQDDVLMGGALSKDDLFEILQEQIDSLSSRSKSPDGISRDDLKPLIKAIQDLRGIGQGGDEAVKKAVDFQMKMTRQLVVQQDIKNALNSRNYDDMKLAVAKAKEINLRTRQARTLENELLAINRELLRKAEEESDRLRKLQKGSESASKGASTAASASGSGSAADTSGISASSDKSGMMWLPGKHFMWRKDKSGRSQRGHNEAHTPDDYQLEDGEQGTTDGNPAGAGTTGEKRKSLGFISKMSFRKLPVGQQSNGSSQGSGSSMKKPSTAKADDELLLTDRPDLSTVTFADSSLQLNETQRASQVDKLIEAMQRVRAVLDAPSELRGPSPILAAAGPDMDLVTGDPSTVHLWLGDFHGVVRTSHSLVTLGSKTTILGEINDAKTQRRWEICIAKEALANTTVVVSTPTTKRAVAASAEASEALEAQATSNKEASSSDSPVNGSIKSEENNSGNTIWEEKYKTEIQSLTSRIRELETELETASTMPHPVREAGAEVRALMEERSESYKMEAKQEEMEKAEEERRLQSVRGDGGDMDDLLGSGTSGESKFSSSRKQQQGSSEYNYEDLDVDMLTIKELKKFITDHGGSVDGLREKDELVNKARSLKGDAVKIGEMSKSFPSSSSSGAAAVDSYSQTSSDDNGPKIKDDERFIKYFKMLKIGLDKEAAKHKMVQDGLDDDVGVMDCDPNMSVAEYERRKKLSQGPVDNGVKLKDDERFAKYFKMLKVGLTKDAVKHKMEQDGLDPDIMDMDPEGPSSAVPPKEVAPFIKMLQYGVQRDVVEFKMKSAGLDPAILDQWLPKDIPRLDIKVGDDPRFKPFFKMLAVGVPKDAVRQKMISKGFDPDILEMDPNEFSPVDGSNINPNKKKMKRKRPDDGMQWKKLYWQTVEVPQPGPGVVMTIWQKDFGFELLEHEKKELRDLFAIKVGIPEKGQKQEAASTTDKSLQILESARAQNVSILLSRFRISVSELRRMICTMRISEGSELGPDDVKSILSMLPTSEEAEKLRALTPDKVEMLGAAEKHFLGLMEIPRYKNRIACFLFKLSFNELKEDVEFDVEAIQKATTELLESRKLSRLLSIILAIGNMLNSCGGLLTEDDGFKPAKGFRLSSLLKLKLSKAHSSNRTALNYFVSILHERQRQVLDFIVAETDNIRAAASVVMSNVKSQVKSLAMGVKELENEVNHAESVRSDPEASKRITQDDEIFFDAVEAFFQKARRDVHDLSVAINRVEKDFALLVEYFREESDTTPEVLFKNLVQFFDDVAAALHENDVARAKAVRLAVAQEGAAAAEL